MKVSRLFTQKWLTHGSDDRFTQHVSESVAVTICPDHFTQPFCLITELNKQNNTFGPSFSLASLASRQEGLSLSPKEVGVTDHPPFRPFSLHIYSSLSPSTSTVGQIMHERHTFVTKRICAHCASLGLEIFTDQNPSIQRSEKRTQ